MVQIKFIHTADLHLDTPFKGLSDWNSQLAGKLRDATYKSFRNIIDLAIYENIDFILIAGDIFDSENMSLSAQLRFLGEMKRLSDNNIPAYFICGNHDHLGAWERSITLPPGIFRFGSSEVERMTFYKKGETLADIYGISYGTGSITENIVPLYRKMESPAPFSIAMLHGMADVAGSHEKYAPFRLRDLLERPFDYWALGHVHTGFVLNGDPPVVYPGNPQGRDFGETGQKGCYLVEMAHGMKPRVNFVPTHHVRFEELKIDLTGLNDISRLANQIDKAMDKITDPVRDSSFVLRILLTGRTELHKLLNRQGEAGQLVDELNHGQLDLDCFTWIDSIEVRTMPPVDLERLKKGPDFVAGIIKYMERYENDGELLSAHIDKLKDELPAAKIFRDIDDFSESEKIDIMEKAKWILLDRLADGENGNGGS